MLEEMGEPRLAGNVVGAADAIPHHVRDDRCAAIGDDDDLHAVGQRELAGAALRRCLRRSGLASKDENGDHENRKRPDARLHQAWHRSNSP
jgi:hypothetical protein